MRELSIHGVDEVIHEGAEPVTDSDQ